ncbi:hypothetical protein ACTXT7_004272 [Hymenolepis weldensis]
MRNSKNVKDGAKGGNIHVKDSDWMEGCIAFNITVIKRKIPTSFIPSPTPYPHLAAFPSPSSFLFAHQTATRKQTRTQNKQCSRCHDCVSYEETNMEEVDYVAELAQRIVLLLLLLFAESLFYLYALKSCPYHPSRPGVMKRMTRFKMEMTGDKNGFIQIKWELERMSLREGLRNRKLVSTVIPSTRLAMMPLHLEHYWIYVLRTHMGQDADERDSRPQNSNPSVILINGIFVWRLDTIVGMLYHGLPMSSTDTNIMVHTCSQELCVRPQHIRFRASSVALVIVLKALAQAGYSIIPPAHPPSATPNGNQRENPFQFSLSLPNLNMLT